MKKKIEIIALDFILFQNIIFYFNQNLNLKIYIKIFKILFCIFILIDLKYIKKRYTPKFFSFYKHYVKDCLNLKTYKRAIINNNIPYISLCLPAYNMKKYIEKSILSILNQSYQDFEIIIVNDNSNDITKDIIMRLQLKDDRIKIINLLKIRQIKK